MDWQLTQKMVEQLSQGLAWAAGFMGVLTLLSLFVMVMSGVPDRPGLPVRAKPFLVCGSAASLFLFVGVLFILAAWLVSGIVIH